MPLIFNHDFHSADSTILMPPSHDGQKNPVPLAGTWGIRTLKGYDASDLTSQAQSFALDSGGDPRFYELQTAGHLTSGTVNRYGVLAFKLIDSANSLFATVNGSGNFVVGKIDASVTTAFLTVAISKPANGVRYGIGIVLSGNNIQAFFNGVYVGSVAMSGADALKYLINSKVGMVENKAGAPTTNLDFIRLSVWEGEWPSWQR